MNKIITISREFGSGGREIGRRLAEKLGVPFYDKKIIEKITEEMGLTEEAISHYRDNNVYPMMTGRSISVYYDEPLHAQVIREQSEFIKKLGEKGPCVIVGRSADYLIKDSFDVMIYADLETRVDRCMEKEESPEKTTPRAMKKSVRKIDKERERYYYQLTGGEWGDKNNYDICINTTHFDYDDVVDMIIDAVNKWR